MGFKTTVGTIFVVAIVLYFTLPAIISVFQQLFGTLDLFIVKPPEQLYGLSSLYNNLYGFYKYFKTLATSDVVAGVLVTIGLILMAFEVGWRRR